MFANPKSFYQSEILPRSPILQQFWACIVRNHKMHYLGNQKLHHQSLSTWVSSRQVCLINLHCFPAVSNFFSSSHFEYILLKRRYINVWNHLDLYFLGASQSSWHPRLLRLILVLHHPVDVQGTVLTHLGGRVRHLWRCTSPILNIIGILCWCMTLGVKTRPKFRDVIYGQP
jgi:hypothetical protein